MKPYEYSRNIVLLVNSRSGKGNGIETGNWIKQQLDKAQILYQGFCDNWPEKLDQFTDVWIVGGDGTVNYFLNRYTENILPLSIFKAGTGNDLAWKLHGDITLQQEFDIALDATPQPVDAAKCNDLFYINSSGVGFDGEVLRSMSAIRWLGGHIGYLSVVLKKIFSFKELNLKIEADGIDYSGYHLLVIVNNSSRTGGGFMVTPNASLTDGKIDMLLCNKLPIWKRLRYLPVIEKGKHLSLPFIIYRQVNKVLIKASGKVYAQLDGELIEADQFIFQSYPARLLIRYYNASP